MGNRGALHPGDIKPSHHVRNNSAPRPSACSRTDQSGRGFPAPVAGHSFAGASRPHRPGERLGQTPAPVLTSVTFPWASRTSLSPTNSSYLSHQVLAVEDARCRMLCPRAAPSAVRRWYSPRATSSGLFSLGWLGPWLQRVLVRKRSLRTSTGDTPPTCRMANTRLRPVIQRSVGRGQTDRLTADTSKAQVGSHPREFPLKSLNWGLPGWRGG